LFLRIEILDFHKRIIARIKKENIDIIILAGYLRLFPVTSKDKFLTINSHPAAIPYFGGPGMWGHHVHEAVLNWAKETKYEYPYTFSTIHVASDKYDEGQVLGIKKLRIENDDTAETLSSRLLPLEHQNYVEVLQILTEGKLPKTEYPKEFFDYI
jgi:phosphoribosylglycinamide formyltransferase-1